MDIRALDTPGKLRALTKQAEDSIQWLPADPNDKDSIFEVIDFAMEKVTKYGNISLVQIHSGSSGVVKCVGKENLDLKDLVEKQGY